ncbi:hypothetical protein VTP01DRAFT_7246 [Rhizomucor pusillus]|uniref:uncharacterized protein n=1 Tax=Rhizomucor pusillus TaxID=4840 RepID=UPI0037447878
MSSSVTPVGVSHIDQATGAYEGWHDFTDIFVDNVVFWRTTMYYLAKNGNETGSGRCPDDSVIPADLHMGKANQLNLNQAGIT